MVKNRMNALLVLIAMLLFSVSLFAEGRTSYKIKSYIDENGDVVNVYRYAGFPPKELPPVNTELPKEVRADGEKGFFALNNVPAYTWCYGCTATATSIIAAYYDNFGAPTVYTGPANGGVAPQTNSVWQTASQADTDQCPLAASKNGVDGRSTRGHGDDYWTGYLDEATDPYYGAWSEHDYEVGQRAAADFMGTNQWYNWENADGSTSLWSSAGGVYDYVGAEGSTPAARDGIHGVRLFYESLGMTVDWNYTRTITGYDDPDDDPDMGPATGGYEFAMYKASIDAGRPVYIQVEGHSMVGFGYDDTYTPPRLYLRDTWDTNTSQTAHYMSWGGVYSNMQHYAISEVILGTECYWAAPENVFALNDNRSVTVTWDDPSKGTKDMSYIVFRDGSQIATGVTTTSYVDNGASDGVHYWSVKAYYIDDSFTSYMSKQVAAYVSPSVTSFYDDFESGLGQWLMDPLTGQDYSWGLDTQYKYAGTYSLSDSPISETYPHTDTDYNVAGYYGDQTELLAAGGSIAEVAPGINFYTAADATCTFWMKYMIEESFDYLYFQACDDGVTWETLRTWSSEEAGVAWHQETISLGLFAGNSNVRFRFYFVSDYGYATEGTNIDNFAITPSSVDGAAPYVYYTKAKDYYSANADGFEITATITDFTGVDYANVLYKVNGGSEQTVTPLSVNGNTYFWKLPVQNPGDMIEFRFDVQDTYSTPNQGFKGPYYYVDGLHQKYDYGTVSSYTYVVPTTVDYDMKSYAVKFSSFYDDIVGAVVRGYIDATAIATEGDNDPMLINVWGDNSGLPGAALITPLSYANPATLSDTNAWAYVDLSSYAALDSMAGDYFIGFECGSGSTGMSRTVQTDCGTTQEFDFGRAYWQYYMSGSPIWEKNLGYNHHIRCITTNYQIQPAIIDPSPNGLAEELVPDGTSSQILTVNNIGGFSLDYNASIDYNGTAGAAEVASNDFNSALGWTSAGTRVWTRSTSLPGLNGSAYATVSAATQGNTVYHSYLTSGIIDMSSYGEGSTISFEQYKSTATSTGGLEISTDGTNWFSIYSNTAIIGALGAPDYQTITIPSAYITSTTRFRFHATLPKNAGSWNIDNIVIGGVVPFSWMTLDGGATTSGTVAVSGSDPMTVGFDAAGLAEGSYTANIRLTSDYSNESVFVELTVTNASPPAAPSLVSPGNASNLVDITPYFDWSTVTDATAYNVVVDNNSDYSSPEIDTEVATTYYQAVSELAVGTYYWKVRSKNAAGYSSFTGSWSVNVQSPIATPSVANLAGAALQNATDSDTFNITNDGNATLNYTISVEYVTSKADLTLLTNDFSAGLGWTASDYLVWAQSSDLTYDLDGTAYARLAADPDDDPNGSAAGVLTSPVFDGTTSYEVWVDFDQFSNLLTSSCLVDYTINGTDWINVYTNTASIGASGAPDHQRIKLPTTSAAMQVRFKANMKNQSGSHWNIDNIVVEGLNPANYGWLSVLPASGSITASNSTQFTATYDATGMDAGTFNANIVIASNDQYEPTQYIPVEFVVTSGTVIPGVPSNIVTSIVSGNIFIQWDDAADAETYDIYTSADPYGTYTLLTNVGVSEYTYTGTESKMFFQIVSKNSTKDSPENIEVKAIKKRTVKDIKLDESGR